jgi:hypothetical protein
LIDVGGYFASVAHNEVTEKILNSDSTAIDSQDHGVFIGKTQNFLQRFDNFDSVTQIVESFLVNLNNLLELFAVIDNEICEMIEKHGLEFVVPLRNQKLDDIFYQPSTRFADGADFQL